MRGNMADELLTAPKPLCAVCGHAESSHQNGRCQTCDARIWLEKEAKHQFKADDSPVRRLDEATRAALSAKAVQTRAYERRMRDQYGFFWRDAVMPLRAGEYRKLECRTSAMRIRAQDERKVLNLRRERVSRHETQ